MFRLTQMVAVAGLWFVAVAGFSPAQNPNQPAAGTALRGKVVRVEGQDRIVVITQDNKEITLMSTPTTRYTINGKAGRFADLRNGVNLNATYNLQENRYMVNTVQVGDATETAPGTGTTTNKTFRGRIVKINTTDNQIVAKTQDGKEVTLYVQKNGRFLRNGQAVLFADLKVDTIIESQYTERENHWWVEEILLVTDNTGAGQPAVDGTQVQGTVVRIVGQNQVVVRTSDNKEVTINLVPQTTYTFNEQPGQLRDFEPGHDVRIQYNTRDRQNIAARIFGSRRNK